MIALLRRLVIALERQASASEQMLEEAREAHARELAVLVANQKQTLEYLARNVAINEAIQARQKTNAEADEARWLSSREESRKHIAKCEEVHRRLEERLLAHVEEPTVQ